MAVIRQFPDNSGCSVCSSLVDLPHRDLSDCRLALAKEMDAILKRARAITEKRQVLTRKRIDELSDLHAPPQKKTKKKSARRR
jgi:hypothetical protein